MKVSWNQFQEATRGTATFDTLKMLKMFLKAFLHLLCFVQSLEMLLGLHIPSPPSSNLGYALMAVISGSYLFHYTWAYSSVTT